MKIQELLIFGSVLIILAILFTTTQGSDSTDFAWNGKNAVTYPAGSEFTIEFNVEETTPGDKQAELRNQASAKYPFSEKWDDANRNGEWDDAEAENAAAWTLANDLGNGTADLAEDFTDCSGEGDAKVCEGDDTWTDDMGNGEYNEGDDFIDLNGNEQWDDAEFSDLNDNGEWDEGEPFTDLGNGKWDGPESWTETTFDGKWTAEQMTFTWTKSVKNSEVETGAQVLPTDSTEPWKLVYTGDDIGELVISLTVEDWHATSRNNKGTDIGNGVYDIGEPFVDCNTDSKYRTLCEGNYTFEKLGLKGNGEWDEGEDFTDLGDGVWNRGEGPTSIATKEWKIKCRRAEIGNPEISGTIDAYSADDVE